MQFSLFCYQFRETDCLNTKKKSSLWRMDWFLHIGSWVNLTFLIHYSLSFVNHFNNSLPGSCHFDIGSIVSHCLSSIKSRKSFVFRLPRNCLKTPSFMLKWKIRNFSKYAPKLLTQCPNELFMYYSMSIRG